MGKIKNGTFGGSFEPVSVIAIMKNGNKYEAKR